MPVLGCIYRSIDDTPETISNCLQPYFAAFYVFISCLLMSSPTVIAAQLDLLLHYATFITNYFAINMSLSSEPDRAQKS
jgi:hypothetical protein